MENGIEEARQRKLETMRKRYSEQLASGEREAQAEAQIDSLMRHVLSPEAKARLGNVKLVNRDLYFKVVQGLMQLYRAGHVQGKVGGGQLKELLEQLSEKRDMVIKRK